MRKVFAIVALLLVGTPAFNQELPFWLEIREYKRQDSIAFPKANSILFVGSSSFAFWKTMQEDLKEYPVINRGFGGSELSHAILYADKIILPYRPKQVVIYSGENDIAVGNMNADSVKIRFTKLFRIIRKNLPKTKISYISMKPSPSRIHLKSEMMKANQLIKDFLKKEKNTSFVDVFPLMLDNQGNPRQELFLNDMLHMNPQGYEIWVKELKKHLEK
jgi:lysophospholipase L1-like esterase